MIWSFKNLDVLERKIVRWKLWILAVFLQFIKERAMTSASERLVLTVSSDGRLMVIFQEIKNFSLSQKIYDHKFIFL